MNAHPRTFIAAPAKREHVFLNVGIIAPSGGGKTFSALRLATGIQSVVGGDIIGLDTENRRMLHYADQFKFQHVPFEPPFGSLDYLEAIKFCAAKKPGVIIVDSMTHEHIGEGGYLHTAEQVVDRIAGTDYAKREKAQFAGWAKAGPLRQRMIEGIKQLDAHFIFCWRAKEKTKPIRKDGKMVPQEMGLMPLAGEEWVYEMAVNIMLPARAGGVPLWRADHIGERLMMKLPKYFEPIFSQERPLDEEHGRLMAEWAMGGKVTAQVFDRQVDGRQAAIDPLIAAGKQAALQGVDALRAWFDATPDARKKRFRDTLSKLQEMAREADKKKGPAEDEIAFDAATQPADETEDVI